MKRIPPDSWLKRTLLLDAATGVAIALAHLLATGTLTDLTGFSSTLVVESGVFLVGYVGLLLFCATRAHVPVVLIEVIILGNVAWAVGSVVAFETSSGATTLGAIYAGIHVVSVLVFAALELVGLRSSSSTSRTTVARAS